jgi:hypothetical protein
MGEKHEKKEVTVGVRIAESTKRQLDKIVEAEDRTIGYVARELMIRGLALYQIDGRLRDEGQTGVKSLKAPLAVISPGHEAAERRRIQREINKPVAIPAKKRKIG